MNIKDGQELAEGEVELTEEELNQFNPPKEEEAEETEQDDTEATEEAEELSPDEGYDFGNGVKFKTQKEAMAYQKQLIERQNIELAEANAYRQAALDLSPNRQQQQQQQAEPEFDEAEYYENPKAVLDRVQEKAEQRILSKIEQKAADERVWNSLVADHPDMADMREEIEAIVNKDPQLFASVARTRGEKAARDLAAQKMRAKVDKMIQARKPKTDLGKQKSVTTNSSQTSVTPKVKQEKPMSMTEQIAMLNQKRKGKQ